MPIIMTRDVLKLLGASVLQVGCTIAAESTYIHLLAQPGPELNSSLGADLHIQGANSHPQNYY
jgi:hypothetical protein